MTTKQLANVLASVLAESEAEHPEGHLYAAVMGHAGLDVFQAAVSALESVGLITRHAGPCVKSTAKLRAFLPQFKAAMGAR